MQLFQGISRLKLFWPVLKLTGKYFPSKDPWVSENIHVPLRFFGPGCVREFQWHFVGSSKVRIADLPSLCEWLAGCEYVRDDDLFQHDDFWQHPCTFEQLRRGDCEDHALWAWRKLIELGIRAELFCGNCNVGDSARQSTHAWVVFHDATGSYLFEPAAKDPSAFIRPLESAKPDYIPRVSVDQHYNRRMYGGAVHMILKHRHEKRLGYDELHCDRILETIGRLELRISERFPGSGLSHVSAQLGRLASEAGARVERLRRPIWLLRIGAGLGILGIVGITLGLVTLGMSRPLGVQGLADLLQAREAAINEIILLAIAIFFLLSLETRVKRRAALKVLHQLRSIVHIVDMHQLTKDPEYLFSPSMATASSPKRALTRFELARYLDYCSELLSFRQPVCK